MQKCSDKLYDIVVLSVRYLSLFLMVFLLGAGAFLSYQAEKGAPAFIKNVDPFLVHALLILAVILILRLVAKVCQKGQERLCNSLKCFVLMYVLLFGGMLIVMGKDIPTADQYNVFRLAELFAMNDLEAIQPTNETYLSFYPHQLGIISFYEIVIRVWKVFFGDMATHHVLKLVNVCGACLVVFFQSKTVRMMSNSIMAEIFYLLLTLLNVPLIFYTSFIYGEILSVACFTGGIYFWLLYEKKAKSVGYLFLSVFFLTAGVVFRKNSLIFVIAVVCVAFVCFIRNKNYMYLLYIVLLLFGACGVLPLIQGIYEWRAQNTLLEGVPAISFIAMGMQESVTGNGFHNGYDFNTYLECGNEAAEVSKEYIRGRLAYFKENPGYAFRFYLEKILCEWTDGTYGCRQAVSSAFYHRSEILASFFDGITGRIFTEGCNCYQTLIYLGSVVYLLWAKANKDLIHFVGFIAVFGGFAFHFMWEANSRYIFPYVSVLIPYAAMGLQKLIADKQ